MGRTLLHFAAALSLALFLAALVARAMTSRQTRFRVLGHMPSPYVIGSRGEYLAIGRMHFPISPAPRDPMGDLEMIVIWRQINGGHGDVPSALGWDYYNQAIGSNNVFFGEIQSFQVLALNYNAMLAWLAILPGLWVILAVRRRNLRKRRAKEGRCPDCGYDLRETPEQCPECGARPASATR